MRGQHEWNNVFLDDLININAKILLINMRGSFLFNKCVIYIESIKKTSHCFTYPITKHFILWKTYIKQSRIKKKYNFLY
jgi:hypothetical protein